MEFDKYAKDSLVADAFVASEKMTEKEVQSKIIEIEEIVFLQERRILRKNDFAKGNSQHDKSAWLFLYGIYCLR